MVCKIKFVRSKFVKFVKSNMETVKKFFPVPIIKIKVLLSAK